MRNDNLVWAPAKIHTYKIFDKFSLLFFSLRNVAFRVCGVKRINSTVLHLPMSNKNPFVKNLKYCKTFIVKQRLRYKYTDHGIHRCYFQESKLCSKGSWMKKAWQKDKLDFAKQEGQHWREHFKVKNIEMIG